MWWNRSSEPSGLPEPGRVTDLRSTPPGVVPRYLQQWLLIGVALVMVGIIALSGAPTRPRPASGPPAGVPVVDPNQQRIEEYRRRIQEQAERLAAEQAELQATKDAVAAHAIPPAESTRPAGVPTAPMPRVREEERRRVADNVAFSRSGSAAPSASAAREAVPTARVPPAVTNAPQPAAALTPAGPSAEAAATAEPATVPQPARASPPEASAT